MTLLIEGKENHVKLRKCYSFVEATAVIYRIGNILGPRSWGSHSRAQSQPVHVHQRADASTGYFEVSHRGLANDALGLSKVTRLVP